MAFLRHFKPKNFLAAQMPIFETKNGQFIEIFGTFGAENGLLIDFCPPFKGVTPNSSPDFLYQLDNKIGIQ